VQNAVQNGIENLSGSSISANGHPQDPYRFRARTKEELLQSQGLAASARDVGRQDRPQDTAAAQLGAQEWEDDGSIMSPPPGYVPPGAVAVPPRVVAPTPPKAPQGWVL
jgi:hypothetical protein